MKLTTDKTPTSNTLGRSADPLRRPPRNYFSRREQVRLLLLCSLLMLVLVMMNEARKPENWDWLWAEDHAVAATPQPESIDTKIENIERALPADGFTAEVPQSPVVSRDVVAYLPEITPELLSTIKDNTVMRAAENEAWMTMLLALQSRTTQQIRSQSRGKVGFAQLFRQTDFYRGQLVTVAGTVLRLEAIAARENEHGISQLYRWILRPQGGDAPIVIYSLEKPTQLALGDGLREPCSFTGFCFKRWAYPAADGTRVAPLLLAKAPEWSPPAPLVSTALPSAATVLTSVCALVAISTVIAIAVYRASNVTRADIDRLRLAESDLEDDLLCEDILPSTAEALRLLAQPRDEQAS